MQPTLLLKSSRQTYHNEVTEISRGNSDSSFDVSCSDGNLGLIAKIVDLDVENAKHDYDVVIVWSLEVVLEGGE